MATPWFCCLCSKLDRSAITGMSMTCEHIDDSGSGHVRKVSLALESVLMSILHRSVMDSLAISHAGADAALYRQTQAHHEAGCQVMSL